MGFSELPDALDHRGRKRALVILVPEAEEFVESFRARFDDLADEHTPAHITINHPFTPGEDSDSRIEAELAALFAEMPAFSFSLDEIRRFPAVLYLAPEPEGPFRDLIAAVARRFPESPPYEGEFAEIVPHMTVAFLGDEADPRRLDEIASALASAADGVLPIKSRAERVALLEKVGDVWLVWRTFPFAGGE